MSARQKFKLDELGTVGRGKSKHRPRNDPSLYGGPYPFFQTGDVKAAELYLREYSQTYSDAGLAQSKLWQPGTLCITIAANVADTAILAIPGCFPDSVVGFIANPEKADARFIKYYIDVIKRQMVSASKGTTQDNLSVDKLLTFDFEVPLVCEQTHIADIISAYDDLIENNTRRIAVLEEMARRIYEEWFVHFRYPGHEQAQKVETELGLVPEGWEIKPMSECIELAYGKALKAENRIPGPFPVYGSSGVVGSHESALVPAPGIVVGRKGNVGSVFWAHEPFYPIDTAYYVKTKLPLLYVFHNLQKQNFINNDAAVPGLSRNQAYLLPVIIPAQTVLDLFLATCQPIHDLQIALGKKNANLRQTRDLLLPRLISGGLDVSKLVLPESSQ